MLALGNSGVLAGNVMSVVALWWPLAAAAAAAATVGFGVSETELNFFFNLVFQWFLTSLSVLPGNCDAITAHLI